LSCRLQTILKLKKETYTAMEIRLLLAIDLSENSLKAVEYAAGILSCHPSSDFTLLHVIKEPSPDVMSSPEERHHHVEELRAKSLALMEQAAHRITSHGIAEKNIHLKIQVCHAPVSIAELILHEQEAGGYGTIVIGRRGLSKREEFLFGSIANKVVREAKNCAVWVIE
jgi:nucleotide-binding universal stress UspA family protein